MQDTTTLTAQDVALAVLDGQFDADLEALSNAIRSRRKDVTAKNAQMNALFLKPGDKVTLNGLSPKTLNGAVVEIVEVKKTRAAVRATEDCSIQVQQRIGMHGRITVPLSCVTKVES